MVTRSASVEWLDTDEPQLDEIETVDEHVDRSDRIILAHIVIEDDGNSVLCPRSTPSTKRFIRCPAKSQEILAPESKQTEPFHTDWSLS